MREFRITGPAATALADHRVQGVSIVPGSLYVELARTVAREAHGSGIVLDATFDRPIVLTAKDCSIRVQREELEDGIAEYRFHEADAHSGEAPAARLRIERKRETSWDTVPGEFSIESFRAGCDGVAGGELIYATLAANGNDYGPEFQRISSLWRSGSRCLAKVSSRGNGAVDPHGVPPSLLDSLVQSLMTLVLDRGQTCVLRSIAKAQIADADLPDSLWAYAVLRQASGGKSFVGDVHAFDPAGQPCIQLTGVTFTLADRAESVAAGTRVVVGANFTAEPVEDTLKFWASQFGDPIQLEFAPYNQLLPQLLDPSSAFRRNRDGANVVLLRLEPWATTERPAGLKADARFAEQCLAGKPVHTLPNALQIAHWNRYETEYLYKEIFEDRCYLRHGIRLPDHATVLDVGANIGLFSLFVKSRCPDARIFAFEPAPAIYELLQANCKAYGGGDLHPVNAGVADQPGTATFTFYENSSAFSGFHTDASSDGAAIRTIVRNTLRGATSLDGDAEERRVVDELTSDRLERSTHECRLTSVSAFLREHGIAKVDLLKIDAEKSELAILHGIEEDDWKRIEQLVVEIHDPSGLAVAQVERLLAAKGFRCAVERERLLEGSGLFNLYATRTKTSAEPSADDPHRASLQRNVDDFCAALATYRRECSTPILLCMCPATPEARANAAFTAALADEERRLLAEIREFPDVRTISSRTLLQWYPAGDCHDPHGHQLGDIPYTARGYAAIGTAVYRALHGLHQAPFKVIALDCDNTLWQGTVGEDGVQGIEISAPFRKLQQFMVERAANGMLLCLCSKNNEPDVLEVFEKRRDMLLKREHLAAWRINWGAKSANLAALAEELGLGLDSFVFLDDNPIDCADVRIQCPGVLALQLPQAAEAIPAFLDHVWAFDREAATEEDRNRTRMYRENAERDHFRGRASSLREFLDGLELRIDIAEATEEQIPRISQLTYRTNQFNSSTVRRSEEEIRRFLQQGTCLAVRVSDRFGDYGLVGVVLYRAAADRYKVDTFLLSCRVLGRGVEHAVLAKLAREAMANGKRFLEIDFRRSEKNTPALEFFRSLAQLRSDAASAWVYPAEELATLAYHPEEAPDRPERSKDLETILKASRSFPGNHRTLQSIAEGLADVDRIAKAIDDFRGASASQIAPAAGPEGALLNIWRRVLGRPRIGMHDNFFDAGGTSLKAVQVIALIKKELNRDVSIVKLFEHPTVALLAGRLSGAGGSEPAPGREDAVLRGRRRRAAMTREAA